MITSVTGTLTRVLDDEVRLRLGPYERQVMVPELVRRTVQGKLGEEVVLHTLEFLEGNPQRGGKMVPRLVGFLTEPEIEFFELFCTVDGIGVKTALKAMVRSVRDIADLIQRQDVGGLAALPGISSGTAERVVAKLRKKVTKFALMVGGAEPTAAPTVEPSVLDEAFRALLSVGHHDADARRLLDVALADGKKFKNSGDLLLAVYARRQA